MPSQEREVVREEIAKTGMFNGFHARPIDAAILMEAQKKPYRRLNIEPGDVVLDLGAHIGTFARYAIDEGASHVIAVEPHPESVELLRMNVQGRAVTVIDSAVDSDILYDSGTPQRARKVPGRGTGRGGWEPIKVSSVTLDELLVHQPTRVKCDIEGGEYDILPHPMPTVRRLALEIHFDDNPLLFERAPAFIQAMRDAGWVPENTDTAKRSFARVVFYRNTRTISEDDRTETSRS